MGTKNFRQQREVRNAYMVEMPRPGTVAGTKHLSTSETNLQEALQPLSTPKTDRPTRKLRLESAGSLAYLHTTDSGLESAAGMYDELDSAGVLLTNQTLHAHEGKVYTLPKGSFV